MWLKNKRKRILQKFHRFHRVRDIIRFMQNNFLKLFTNHIIHRPKIHVGPFVHSKQLCNIFFFFHNIQEMIHISFFFFLLTFTFFLPHTYLLLLTHFFNKYPLFLQYVTNILIYLQNKGKDISVFRLGVRCGYQINSSFNVGSNWFTKGDVLLEHQKRMAIWPWL